MAQLPADRTKLAQAQSNMAPSLTASSQKTKEALTEAYDTIDLLNQKVDTHGSTAVLPHPDQSVTTEKVKDAAITTVKLADASVTSVKLADGSVTATKFPDNGITSVKIADQNVTTPKIADGAVTSLKIADGGVTGAKIADNTITTQKLVDSIITAAKILDGSVTNAKLAPGSVTGDKVANGAINSQHMDAALLASAASLSVQSEFDKRGVNVQKYASIQQALDAATSGDTIIFPEGVYLIDNQITATGKELHLIAIGNVVIKENTLLNKPMILLTSCHNSTIEGIKCEGKETLAGFIGDPAKDYAFIKVVASENVRIYNPVVTNKTYGVILDTCNKCKVFNPTVTGFMTTGDIASNGANYNSGVYILGGKKNSVHNLTAKDTGTGVTISNDGQYHTVDGAYLDNVRDNGIYISSGTGSKVLNVDIDSAVSSGIKARGSKHQIRGCNVKNVLIGYSLTGNGTTPDSLGYNGYGTICEGNTAENASRMGLEIGIQDGFYPRDFKVLNNNFINCGDAGNTYAAIKVSQGAGHQIKGNTIDGCTSDFGILLNGTSTNKCKKYDVSQNTVRGNGTTPKYGIRALYVDGSQINKNIFESLVTNGIDCRFVTNNTIDGNSYPEGLAVLLSTSFQSSGNVVSNNIGSDIAPDLTQNVALGNLPSNKNFLSSIAAIPYARGQKAIVQGVLYESVGNTATSEWKPSIGKKLSATIGTAETAVSHGLGFVPTNIQITPKGNGVVWQTATAPTNADIYLAASVSIPVDIYVS